MNLSEKWSAQIFFPIMHAHENYHPYRTLKKVKIKRKYNSLFCNFVESCVQTTTTYTPILLVLITVN